MKLQILYLLSCTFLYLSKCQDIVKPTNYTLSYFKNLKTINCKSDNDCPEYSKCQDIDENGETHSVCSFDSFLCPETINNNNNSTTEKQNEFCLYINTDLYNLDKEENSSYIPSDSKPIIKSCPKLQLCYEYEECSEIEDEDETKCVIMTDCTTQCSTEICYENNDCLSGKCMNNYCVNDNKTNPYIYRCTSENGTVKCKKRNYMECENDEDCYSGECDKYNICNVGKPVNKKSTFNVLILLFGLFLFILILLIWWCTFTEK